MWNESFLLVCYLITEAFEKFMVDVVGKKWINRFQIRAMQRKNKERLNLSLAITTGSNKKHLLLGFGYSDTSTYAEGNIRCVFERLQASAALSYGRCSRGFDRDALRNILPVDLLKRCAKRIDTGRILVRPMTQQGLNRPLLLLEISNVLLFVSQQPCQAAPIGFLIGPWLLPFTGAIQKLLHLISCV